MVRVTPTKGPNPNARAVQHLRGERRAVSADLEPAILLDQRRSNSPPLGDRKTNAGGP